MGPSLVELCKMFFLLGLVSFGPGMFALIHQRLVEQKKWITEGEFEEAVTFAELAPGPFTVHLVMYIGYHLQKTWGLIAATVFFCLPSLIVVFIIALTYEDFLAGIPGLEYFMLGVWAAIIASMVATIIRVGKHTLVKPILLVLTLLNISVIVIWKVNFIWMILLSGVFYMGTVWGRKKLTAKKEERVSP